MKKILSAVALVSFLSGKAQTIVNTYDLMSEIDSTWSATTDLQGTFAAGNGVFSSLNSGLGIGRSISEKSELWIVCGYNYASESNEIIYSTGFANLRFHYDIGKDLQIQTFHQRQFNSVLKIRDRELYGYNISKKIKTKEFAYQIAGGMFHEKESYTNNLSEEVVRANTAISITTEVSNVDVNLAIYYQPITNAISMYRMLGELELQFPIKDQLEFEIESALRFDSNPYEDLLPLDFSAVMGIVYSLDG